MGERVMPEPKIKALRAAMGAGDWRAAIGIAARFPALGGHDKAIRRAWEAYARPGFQRQLGADPGALIEAGKAALRERYGRG